MNALVVYWHPEPKSFNHAMFVAACESLADGGWTVQSSDLHTMAFDPVSGRRSFTSVKDADYLKVQAEELHASTVGGFDAALDAEIRKVEACDLMIWQFPLWWFSVPAALKGWVDRVFAMGRLYGGGRIYDTGLCKGKRALLSLTTGGPAPSYMKDGFNGDLAGILRPIHRGILQFTGFDVLAPHVVYGPARLTEEQRQHELQAFRARLAAIAGEHPIDVGRY